MADRSIVTPEIVRQLLTCDPATGALYFKEREPKFFKDGKHSAVHSCAAWNARHSGRRADRDGHNHGYKVLRLLDFQFLAHRVVWAWVNRQWPVAEIDHINGSRSDNAIKNLREATRTENVRNKFRVRESKWGHRGIRCTPTGIWQASICRKHIGNFKTKGDAIAARLKAEAELGFTFQIHPQE